MPFTFAHPAATLPLLRPLGQYGVMSALVIGSLTPDLPYLLPLGAVHIASHTIAGVFWFCIPIGLLSYATFHILLKGPLLGLLPDFLFSRLGAYAARFQSLPPVSWASVLASLFFGASTHLIWDSFTHQGAPAVNLFPVLQSHLFSVGTYQVYLFKLLQHASTSIGLLLLALWLRQWIKTASVNTQPLPIMLSTAHRYIAATVIVLAPTVVGITAGMSALNQQLNTFDFQFFAGRTVFSSMPAFFLAVAAYSIGWHLWRLRG